MNLTDGGMTAKRSAAIKTVGIISLGCAKNLVNSEQMMFLIKSAGFYVTEKTEDVDAVVVNTCAFIEAAKMEGIETILELGRKKSEGRIGRIIVAGCLAQRYKEEILKEMPEADAVLGVGSFDDIVKIIEAVGKEEKPAIFGEIDAPVSETERIITTSPVWTYIKIAEGCDNRCAYCVIPDIRGRFRSRLPERIVEEAYGLTERGVRELIIVAQDVTRYGRDIYGESRLVPLLKALCGIEKLKWIRLHYLYPDEISDELIDVIAENDKILKYLDIPIQHINDGILRKMNRRGSGGDIRALIIKLRERIPGVVIRTSVITGLPGEGDGEFEELCEFLRWAKLERAGIFAYSPEEGTPAALMDRPDEETAAYRAELLTDIQSQIMEDFSRSRIGGVSTVLIEGYGEGRYYGRSFAESPDVDGYIYIEGGGLSPGGFVDVRFTGVENGEPVGEALT